MRPKKIPALEIVPTGEVIKVGNKTYKVMKIERAKKYK